MTIFIQHGDLLSVKQGIIIHGCNAQGVMGSGVAKQIKARYPDAFRAYLEAGNNRRGPVVGDISFCVVAKGLIVVNAITQEFYGRDGRRYVSYDAVRECCEKINKLNESRWPLHFPQIGAGLGGGDWSIISSILDNTLVGEKTLWLQP